MADTLDEIKNTEPNNSDLEEKSDDSASEEEEDGTYYELQEENDSDDDIDSDEEEEPTSEDEDEKIEEDDNEFDDENAANIDINELNDKDNGSELLNIINENIDSSSEEEDEEYLQKFDIESRKKYIENYHQEALSYNHNEIQLLSKVHRNEHNIIDDPFHKTIPFLTKYEKTKIIGLRVKQLNNGAEPYISNVDNILDNKLIAMRELNEKKLPIIIERPIPNNKPEFWKLRDLQIL